VNRLGEAIDTRGNGGYVVAPGSLITNADGDELPYVIEHDVPCAALPAWVPSRLTERKEPLARPDDADLENSIASGSRDTELTRWAGVLRGQGLSTEEMLAALKVMNETRCSPPLEEHLVQKIATSIGKKSRGEAEAFIEFMPPTDAKVKEATFWANDIDEATIQPTDWIIKGRFARKFLTVTLAPGGVGKSRVAMAEAIAIAANIQGMAGKERVRSCGAGWYYSTEDPRSALEERVAGYLKYHRLETKKVPFSVTSGVALPLVLVKKIHGEYVVNDMMIKHIIQTIKNNNIALFTIDPFIKCHALEENDNTGLDRVASALAYIADEGNCGVHVIHHTKKLGRGEVDWFRGNMDVGRGASSFASAARIVHTLTNYNQELDEDEYQVVPSEAWRWVRLDDAKNNMAPRSKVPMWWNLESIRLACHVEADDSVGVAVSKEPGKFDDTIKEQLNRGFVSMVGRFMDNQNVSEIKVSTLANAVTSMSEFINARKLDGFAGGDKAARLKIKIRELFVLGFTIGNERYFLETKGGSDTVVREHIVDKVDFL
jgi:hypothetical protein